MDVKNIITLAINTFNKRKIKFPHFEAEILLSFILQKPREFLLTYPEYIVSKTQVEMLNALIKKRMAGEPIAYLTGAKEFYGFKFNVNKNVLIPRPETELMVDEAIKIAHKKNIMAFLDVGTGSGCIIISLAKILGCCFKYYGFDISAKAVLTARKNARMQEVEFVKFTTSNLLKKFKKCNIPKNGVFILANLPYLTPKQIKKSKSIKNEPKLALLAGKDGLKYYKTLFKQINILKLKNFHLLIEIDPAQKNKISSLIKKSLPETNFIIKKDLRGHSRMVMISDQS